MSGGAHLRGDAVGSRGPAGGLWSPPSPAAAGEVLDNPGPFGEGPHPPPAMKNHGNKTLYIVLVTMGVLGFMVAAGFAIDGWAAEKFTDTHWVVIGSAGGGGLVFLVIGLIGLKTRDPSYIIVPPPGIAHEWPPGGPPVDPSASAPVYAAVGPPGARASGSGDHARGSGSFLGASVSGGAHAEGQAAVGSPTGDGSRPGVHMVILKDGTPAPKVTVEALMISLKALHAQNFVAFFDLVEKCKNPNYSFPSIGLGAEDSRSVLRRGGWLDANDIVVPLTKAIVLNSVVGEGFDMQIGFPLRCLNASSS